MDYKKYIAPQIAVIMIETECSVLQGSHTGESINASSDRITEIDE